MTPASLLNSGMEITIGGQQQTLTPMGAGSLGTIYKTAQPNLLCRLVGVDGATMACRNTLQNWHQQGSPPGMAAIVSIGQVDKPSDYYAVVYQVGANARPLSEVLEDSDVGVRTRHIVAALRAVDNWRRVIRGMIIPLPAEVVFPNSGEPLFLPWPVESLPDIDTVMEEPIRGFYLAPEYARGNKITSQDALVHFGAGIWLYQCLYDLPAINSPEEVLISAATGEHLRRGRLSSNLPFWVGRLSATGKLAALCNLLLSIDPSVRTKKSLSEVADTLEGLIAHLEPITAARELRNAGNHLQAYELMKDTLATQDTYENLVFAGDIAARYLDRSLEAIDLYERAVQKDVEDKSGAYLAQFRAIVVGIVSSELSHLRWEDSPLCNRLDMRVVRNFDEMSSAQKEELELERAQYHLARRKYEDAARFIYQRLFDGQNYLWWKFSMVLAYARASVGMGRQDTARKALENFESSLKKSLNSGNLENSEYESHVREYQKVMTMLEGPGATVENRNRT